MSKNHADLRGNKLKSQGQGGKQVERRGRGEVLGMQMLQWLLNRQHEG